MRFKQKIMKLLQRYEAASNYYLTLTELQQHLIDDYYLTKMEEGMV